MDNYVGPYRIIRLIKRGGQGSVYLGFDKRLHRRVAIKIYDLPTQRAARKKVLHEAQLLANLQSAKIVQVYDVIESGSHMALVMEYVPGCNLEELLQHRRPALSSVVTVGNDLAGALAIARQQRIVHGDLKAENILITEAGRAKLTDFGISRGIADADAGSFSEKDQQFWAAGSLTALAPEHLSGAPIDERADLFALGCLLYRMLSGQHPFYRELQFNRELLLQHPPPELTEVVSGDVELPESLVALIAHLLQKDPQQRPANTRSVRRVLREVSRGLPQSTRDSLMHEARPLFRPESAEDIPLQIPESLQLEGKSRLRRPSGRLGRLWYTLAEWPWPARAALGLTALGLAALAVNFALNQRVTLVTFTEPHVTMISDTELPRELSRKWLVQEVKHIVQEELGRLHVIGSVGAGPVTTLYSVNAAALLPTEPEQVFRIDLRCSERLCVFALVREHGEARYNQQVVLFPDTPINEWQGIVRSTARALFP